MHLTLENLFRGRPDDEQGEKRANFEKATSLALVDLRSLRNNADLVFFHLVFATRFRVEEQLLNFPDFLTPGNNRTIINGS